MANYPRIIPVLDVQGGVVVRGAGGRRHEYQPIISRLTSSTEPVEVAAALIETFRPAELYLADLDAIAGGLPAVAVYGAIGDLGIPLWVDAGVWDGRGAERVAVAGCNVVAGLETIPGPEALREIVSAVGTGRVVFSLDLRDGVPMRDWPNPVPMAIACGLRRLIVLDLARVGGGAGTGTGDLCRKLAEAHPDLDLVAGGGISGWEDVRRLEACGVTGVLVASALHDGRIRPDTRHETRDTR